MISLMCPLTTIEEEKGHDQGSPLAIFTISDIMHKEWVTSVGKKTEMQWLELARFQTLTLLPEVNFSKLI